MKMKGSKIFLGVISVSLAIIGIVASAAFAQRQEIGGLEWRLIELNGRSTLPQNAFLKFDAEKGRFMGNGGCNRIFGGLYLKGNRIDLKSVGSTKMACVDQRASQIEATFICTLGNVRKYRRLGSMLELLEHGKVVLKFRRQSAGAIRLEDKKWVVDKIEGKTIRLKGTMPFVVFDSAKSSAGGNSGCNVFGGSYAVSGNAIRIFDTISTMRACIEDERMNIERRFMDALQNANRFEISGGKLYLYRKNTVLISLIAENK